MAWSSPAYNDAGWGSGPAQLGYGDGDEDTVVDDGPDNNRHITTYFRHLFVAPSDPQATALEVRVLRDDGAIAYLNGVEIFRQNLPGGAVDYQTLATSTVVGSDEITFFSQAVDVLTLLPGTNVLSAEIHQRSATNPDISFDAQLILTSSLRAPAILTHPASASADLGSNVTFTVAAVGAAPLGYQWTRDGSAFPGSTGLSLSLSNLFKLHLSSPAIQPPLLLAPKSPRNISAKTPPQPPRQRFLAKKPWLPVGPKRVKCLAKAAPAKQPYYMKP